MTEKKSKRDKKFSIEELYQNKNFVPPKEQNLETIFEEPRKSKDGMPVLTSVRKYKRYLHFDPTEGKIQKRKMKAKKCINKIKLNRQRTRSATKTVSDKDISLYILETIGGSSDSDLEATPEGPESTSGAQTKATPGMRKKVSKASMQRNKSLCAQSSHEVCDSMSNQEALEETSDSLKAQDTITAPESQQSTKTESLREDSKGDSYPEELEVPVETPSRRPSCLVN